MAGPTPTLPDQDEDTLNVGQQHYEKQFNDIAKAEEAGTFKDIADNFDKSADPSQEDANIKKLDKKESESVPTGDWKNRYEGGEIDKSRLQKGVNFIKKRGAIFGIVGVLGLGGGIMATFLAPAGMLVSIMENFISSNDSSSTALERRIIKVLGNAANGDEFLCTNKNSIKCKKGKVSYKALSAMSKKGIIPLDDAGVMNLDSENKYPDRNPRAYRFTLDNGSTVDVPKNQLATFLSDRSNSRSAAKMLGAGGAFNMRVKAWSGKYITQRLYSKFGLERKGGIADGDNRNTRYNQVMEKLKGKIPGLEKLGGAIDSAKAKVAPQLERSKKGGAGYVIAAGSCIAVKAPGYIAAAVAAVQLARIMPVAMETILSPGSKLKASGVDPAAKDFSDHDMNAAGIAITNTTPNKDGRMTSALDSKYLQAAAGINTNKPPVSTDFAPGYAAMTLPAVLAANSIDKATAPACNAILSPTAMYTAMAVDSATTVALSATIFGGIIKVVAGIAISEIAVQVASAAFGAIGPEIIMGLAENDAIPSAEGEELGDLIGISASAHFASGGMARNLPVLKESQLGEFVSIQQENEAFKRDMDIASLSPFDTSSRYTFMGSIVHTLRNTAIATGGYTTLPGFVSTFSSLIKNPFSSNAKATSLGFSESSCGYAADFGLVTEDPANTPAINQAGLPCTGFTREQANMPVSLAEDLIINEGWLDESKPLGDNATLEDMLKSNYIRPDTPLRDAIETCGDASTGDYLFNSAGCTVNTTSANPDVFTKAINAQSGSCTSDGCITDIEGVGTPQGLKDGRSMAAISVFLLDFQAIQSVNGEDENTGAATASTEIDLAAIFEDSTGIECAAGMPDAGLETGYYKGVAVPIRLCSIPADLTTFPQARVNSRVSGAVFAMLTQMKADLGLATVPVTDTFRTMAEQQCVAAGGCGAIGPAAQPGFSNHQMGIAIDFNVGIGSAAPTAPGNPVWEWLTANAGNYQFKQLPIEAWHWSPAE